MFKSSDNLKSQVSNLILIALLGVIVYSNSFNCSFHFDDLFDIRDNSKIRNLWNVIDWWNYAPSRPVGFFTFALNYHFNKTDVWGYHFVNLFIHICNAYLMYWLVLQIFSTPFMRFHQPNK